MAEDDFDSLFTQLTDNINVLNNKEFVARLKKKISTPEQYCRLVEVFEGMVAMLESLISGAEEN